MAVGELAAGLPVTRPAVWQHLKVLREAALVQVRVDGQRRIYTLDPRGLGEMDDWLAGMRRFWAPRLDALDRELRKAEPATAKTAKRSRR